MTVSGKIADILFASPSFSVISFQTSGQPSFCAVGDIASFRKGDFLEVTGDWRTHPKFGRQFQIQAAVRPIPTTAAAIERFLSHSVHGCGPKTARRIVTVTGDQFDGVLQKEPETLLSVKGVNRTLLERIREAWNRNSLEKQVSLFLAENEVGLGWTNKVAKHFGSDALRTLKENPYRFIDIEGIGFKKADEIALRMGWEKTSAQRAEAILIYLMQEALGNGHVFLRQPELTQQMHESGVPASVAAAALEAQARRATITRVRGRDIYGAEVVFIYLPHMLQYETGLAASIQARISPGAPVLRTALHSMIDEAENQLGVELTEPQRDAVTNAFQQGLSIVTGSPGTGKSTLVKVLTRVASRMNQKVLLTAPTGRASKNLANITEHPASTIHALLEYNPAEDNWKRNRQNPLEGDLVVIDEGSMVELEVAYRLFDAIPPSANVLIIGDDNQLPSVGPGRVLNDLIESGKIPIVRLSKVHRQAARSQIVRNAQRVLEGNPPAFAPADAEGHPTDCHLLQPPGNLKTSADRTQWIRNTLVDVVRRRLPARYGVDPLKDIQVLSPMRKGSLGVYELNTLLQEALNPKSPQKTEVQLAGRLFRVGDRILFNKNNRAAGVCNGDMGILRAVDFAGRSLALDVDDRAVRIEFDDARQLSLAYVITVHKSQGGEYPMVVALFFHAHFVMLQRNLLYTAMTRAKQRLVLLATPGALEMAADNSQTMHRNTLLAKRIQMLAARKAA